MANCTNCGRELPSFTWGEQRDLCPACAQISAQAEPPPTPAPVAIRHTFPITKALVFINVLVFVAMAVKGVSPLKPTTDDLLRWGANWGPLSLGNQPWRIFTSNYVHVGILHIGLNMWCLWNLGWLAEHVLGGWTYVLTYTICGIAGSLVSLAWHPFVIGAGASGAIFGLAGTLITALYLSHSGATRESLRGTIKSLVMFAVYNLAFGAAIPGIDNSAHVGGLVTGLALGALLAKSLRQPGPTRAAWQRTIFAAAVVVLLAGFLLLQRSKAYVVPLGKGINAFKANQFAEAEPLLEQAAARKPNDLGILMILVNTYMQRHEFDKALPVLKQLSQMVPNDADIQLDLGAAYMHLGQFDEAIPPLQRAVQLNPKDPDAQKALRMAMLRPQVGDQ